MGLIKKLFNKNLSQTRFEMVQDKGNGFYEFGNNIYKSDIIRSIIRVQSKSVGKLIAQHIREDSTGFKIFPEVYLKMLLQLPNPYMSMQVLLEKITTQLVLNGNSFTLIIRNEAGYPIELQNINCVGTEAIYNGKGELFLKFYMKNGKQVTYPYSDVLHLRTDFESNDIFGESPAQSILHLLEVVNTTDQGIIKAITNSSVIKWLLRYKSVLRQEDIVGRTRDFANNFLNVNNSVSVAGVDASTDATQVSSNEYVPNADVSNITIQRIYSFFNTNEDIVQSKFTEDGWNSYYESVIEPIAMQLSNEFTKKIFSRREIGFGNKIVFSCNNLQYASMSTKLSLQGMVDRGIMNINEVRTILNLPPTEDGDIFLLRKDTGTRTDQTDSEKGGVNVSEENKNNRPDSKQ